MYLLDFGIFLYCNYSDNIAKDTKNHEDKEDYPVYDCAGGAEWIVSVEIILMIIKHCINTEKTA